MTFNRSSTPSSVQTNESGLLLTLDLLDFFADFDMFYDLKADRIDRCANKSKHSTNVAPKAACGLILLATLATSSYFHTIFSIFSVFVWTGEDDSIRYV